jgi:drug/metabolite transporter (DMT)-like permease
MGVLLALGTAISYSVMNLSIRKGAQVSGDNGVLTTLVVNVAAFTLLAAVTAAGGTFGEVRAEALFWFAMIGVVGAYLGRTFLFGGIRRIGVVRAGAIKNGSPLVTVGLAITWIGERPEILEVVGMAIILVGVFLVVRESLVGSRAPMPASPAPRSDRAHVAGVTLALLAALAFGSANAISKVGMSIVPDAIQAGVVAAWTALAIYLLTAVLRGETAAVSSALAARQPWFWLAGLATTAGQLTFFLAVQVAPVGPVTVVTASEVVITTVLAAALVQRLELVTLRLVVPVLLVFAGTVMIALGR